MVDKMAEYDRFRSFVERYLVARAEHFGMGKELEQGWQTILDAKTLYGRIAAISKTAEPSDIGCDTRQAGQSIAQAGPGPQAVGSVPGMLGLGKAPTIVRTAQSLPFWKNMVWGKRKI